MKLVFPFLVALAVAFGFSACGGSSTNNAKVTPDAAAGDDAGDDAGGDDSGDMPDSPPLDHGQPSTTYPAFKPDMPQLQSNGGVTLVDPVIVTVTWDTDPLQAQLEAFDDAMATSPYWSAITKEYGVNAATSGMANHVRNPVTTGSPLPSTFSETSIETFLSDKLSQAPGSGYPIATAQMIYIIYLHPNTKLTRGGSDICSLGIGGYHTSLNVNGLDVVYAMVPRCNFGGTLLDNATATASHELGEAAIDPHPRVLPGYTGFDSNHVAWYFFHDFQPENGDACEFYQDSFYKEQAPLAFQVQRLWSNAAASAGKMPCVPARAGAYFNVTPTALENVTADLSAAGIGIIRTKGIKIPVGTTKTFPVGFYSDRPTASPWSIRVAEAFYPSLSLPRPSSNHLAVSVDKTSGVNGEIAYVTVTVKTAGQALVAPGGLQNYPKLNFVTVLSSLDGVTSYMPILIVN